MLHSRGVNMRHLDAVLIAAHRPASWRPNGAREVLKQLSAPRQATEAELLAVLKCQSGNLRHEDRIRLVPTLLQLGSLVGSRIALSLGQYSHFENVLAITGDHPYSQAMAIAFECKALVMNPANATLIDASPSGLLAVYHLLKHLERNPFPPQYQNLIRIPNREWLQLAPKIFPKSSPVLTDVVRFYQGYAQDPLWDALKDAAKEGDIDVVKRLASKHQSESYNAVYAAASALALSGRLKDLQDLLEKNSVNLGVFHHQMRNGLQWACEGETSGATEVARLYLGKGMPPDIFCTLAASQVGNLSTLELLLEYKCDLNEAQPRNGATPLTMAAEAGNVETVKWLLAHGASINKRKVNGVDALLGAAEKGRLDVVRLLLSQRDLKRGLQGARLGGANALFLACQNENLDVAELLLESEYCNINTVRDDGTSVVVIACFTGRLDILNFLLANKASVVTASKDGTAPIHIAAQGGHASLVKRLLEAGALADQKDAAGVTALLMSAKFGNVQVARALLAGGAKKNFAWKGSTAYTIAMELKHTKFAKVVK